MNILFMGTPVFAKTVLAALIDAGHDICAVVTQPDKPTGRGYQVKPTPVKELALLHGIEVYQPDTLKNEALLSLLKQKQPQLIAVAAYGKILPEYILHFPAFGCVNVHASLLPKYRGAAPINWAIISGETKTGITTMFMEKGIDTGDMLLCAETNIAETDNAESLHDRLADIGAALLLKTIEGLEKKTITPVKQDNSLSCYAPMISKEDCKIDFTLPAIQVFNKIRGLSPVPCAYTSIDGVKIKIYASCVCKNFAGDPAAVLAADKGNGLIIGCADGAVRLTDILPAGKRRMSDLEYLAGHSIPTGIKAD